MKIYGVMPGANTTAQGYSIAVIMSALVSVLVFSYTVYRRRLIESLQQEIQARSEQEKLEQERIMSLYNATAAAADT